MERLGRGTSRGRVVLLFVLLVLLLSSCSTPSTMENAINAFPEADSNEEPVEELHHPEIAGNPIDEAFKEDFEIASSTPERNYVSNKYLEAWQDEWDHITNTLMNEFEMAEDQETIMDYRTSFQAYAQKLFEVEWLSYTDTSVPAEEYRLVGTGAISGATLAQADAYKREVLLWIDRYYIEGSYIYKYEGYGAELLEIRERESD